MTFEEFKEMAINPPCRDVDTIFVVIEYDVRDLPWHRRCHYPKFGVRHFCVGYGKTLIEAENIMKEAIREAGKHHTEIYCFHIKEYPIGEYMSYHVKEYPIGEYMSFNWEGYGVSWRLYDSTGRFLDRTYCSDLELDHRTPYGQYCGRPEESFRFKGGDIVEVLDGDEVRLAVATGSPLNIEWYWELRERMRKRVGLIGDHDVDKAMTDDEVETAYNIPDSSDDKITVIDGSGYFTSGQILNIMPLRYPISKKLRERYEGHYRVFLKGASEI